MFFTSHKPPVLVKPKLSMVFNPSAWNDSDTVDNTNCLAYALDEPDLGFPYIDDLRNRKETQEPNPNFQAFRNNLNPERGKYRHSFGRSHTVFEWAHLKRVLEHAASPEQNHIIAFSAKWGHFWRMDGNKTWSHKIGKFPATNKDVKGSTLERLEGCTLYDAFMLAQLSKVAMRIRGEPVIKSEDVVYYALPKNGLLVVPKPRQKPQPFWGLA